MAGGEMRTLGIRGDRSVGSPFPARRSGAPRPFLPARAVAPRPSAASGPPTVRSQDCDLEGEGRAREGRAGRTLEGPRDGAAPPKVSRPRILPLLLRSTRAN
jgi:hypothetical protein